MLIPPEQPPSVEAPPVSLPTPSPDLPPAPEKPPSRKKRKKLAEQEALAAAAAEAAAVPFPAIISQPGLLPEDSMAEAGRKILRYHFAIMLSHEEGTRLGEDIEALHDMRVATRRMRAAGEIFGLAFEMKAIKPHLRGLRAVGRALGRARDMDVFIEKAGLYRQGLPIENQVALVSLIQAWEADRAAARAHLLEHLNSEAYQHFKLEFNLFLHTPGMGALPVSQDPPVASRVREVAPALIYTRLEAVRAYEAILPQATIPQLHLLRIEFKKLRYAVEFFREVLGETAKEVIAELKVQQDHLGDLHDADVACQIIRQFLDDWEARQITLLLADRQATEPIVTYLAAKHAERHHLLATYPATWARFNHPDFRRNLALAVAAL